ncbi:MAG: C39 family peptidase [Anaerolineales bacterium]|nr:C39 family peptidase [Anaerolineales bacterium]
MVLWFVPNLPERLGWRWQEFWAGARRQALQLPDTLPTPLVAAAATEAPAPTATPALSATEAVPLPTAASPRPAQVELTGVTQVWQRVNNCGPATLAMALGYWGWKGTQANTANALKPDPNDRNVSPDEMAAYARKVGLGAEVRVGGTLERVQALLAAGFPVILETTLLLPEKGWEGHYTLVTGYSDEHAQFTTQDSLRGPNFVQAYADLQRDWRAFNYLYVVLYAPERQAEVLGLLGPEAEPTVSWQHAAEIARQETAALSGEDLAFAWFNLGTSLTLAGDWAGAAAAYDAARQAGLPWRMLWYQHGPLNAYYEAGRYDDVITLADATLIQADGIEEIYYWRGQARLALGDQAGAVADWRAAVHFNRNYPAPVQSLGALGLTP